jgi:DNA-directed RNA polymerase subunit M/transcription elongation factor TFIIS
VGGIDLVKSCKNCSNTVIASASKRNGLVFYDNKGNAINNCPKCGHELKDDDIVDVNLED